MKQVLLGLIMALWMIPVLAQDGGTVTGTVYWSEEGKEPSEEMLYIPLKGDRVDYIEFQRGIQYRGADGEKKDLGSWEAEKIKFEFNDRNYTFIATSYNGSRGLYYARVDDKLRLLESHSMSRDSDTGIMEEQVIEFLSFEDGDQGLNQKIYLIGFKGAMKKYFADYPDIVQMIKKKQFKYGTVDKLVEYFNAKYGHRKGDS